MWAGLTLLLFGIPSIAFGFYMKRAPSAKVRANKKSKKMKKVEAPKSGGNSFIYGGLFFTILGIFAIVRDVLKF